MSGPDDTSRHGRDTAFGPPSDPIDIHDFVQNAGPIKVDALNKLRAGWQAIPDDDKRRVEKELSLLDLQEDSEHILSSDALRKVFVQRFEDHAVKKKEYDAASNSTAEDPQVAELAHLVDEKSLKHWPPSKQSIYYFRKNKRAEENALINIRLTENGTSPTGSDTSSVAIVTVSYYSRVTKPSNRNESWTNNFELDAVYSFLSSQTLQDVYDAFPCPVKHLPTEKWEGSDLVGYEMKEKDGGSHTGGFIIGDCAYGDEDGNWARQLLKIGSKSGITQIGTPMVQTVLGEMHLKVQMPYWILHQGNCYHCIVISSIRLISPTDPSNNYPIASFLARQHIPTCHHCGRNPVTLVVNGDTRLGESPSRLCQTCWRVMGLPKGDLISGERVIVVPFMG